MAVQTLEQGLSDRRNSLNALRLVLALLVIVSHAPVIVGSGPPHQWGDLDVGGWAVAGFFAISGWLITGSRLGLDLRAFMWRRLLRIMPAFWVALLVTATVFAPLSAAAAQTSVDVGSAVGYVVRNAGLWVTQREIAGSLVTNPDQVWNVSLWTLFWEMCCYVGVALLVGLPLGRHRRGVVLAVFAAVLAANVVIRTLEVVPPSSAPGAAARLGSFFLAGAVLRLWADRVPLAAPLAGLSAAALLVLWPLGLVGALAAAPVAYLSLWGGARLPLSGVGARNDVSYGVYVYGYPVGQLLVVLGAGSLPAPLFVAANMLAVLPLAWASWLLVERPALRFKDAVPRRERRLATARPAPS